MKITLTVLVGICCILQMTFAQQTVEAELDTAFFYAFPSLHGTHQKKLLIDIAHNTIYSEPHGKATAREMLRICEADGFTLKFTDQALDHHTLNAENTDLLLLHGMPNDKITLDNGTEKEILFQSPLQNEEVSNIGRYVFEGGGLLLFLSHFPGGSGALPLLELFGVKFRDGYAHHPRFPASTGGLCSHLTMNAENNLLKRNHPVLNSCTIDSLLPQEVKFLCGAAVFRNPEEAILAFPPNTTNYTPSTDGSPDLEETADNYAGMIGFNFGKGRVIICTDQGIFRSLDLLIDGAKIPVTIHDPECDNAALLLNSIRWLTHLQGG